MIDLKRSKKAEKQKDNLGGGGFLKESDIYEATIKIIYFMENKKTGSIFANCVFDINGMEYKENFCVQSGTEKGSKTYYEKNGKEFDLPGYSHLFNICAITTGEEFDDLSAKAVEKGIMIYDFDQRKNVETLVPVMEELTGKKVMLGIRRRIQNKRKQNPSTGQYEKVNEKREFNELHTSFFPDSMLTVAERLANITEAEFHTKWLNKWQNNTVDEYKVIDGALGSIKTDPAANQGSLFNNDDPPY